MFFVKNSSEFAPSYAFQIDDQKFQPPNTVKAS